MYLVLIKNDNNMDKGLYNLYRACDQDEIKKILDNNCYSNYLLSEVIIGKECEMNLDIKEIE